MAVDIEIINGNNKKKSEGEAAKKLKYFFERDFSKKDINGEILIIANATLFGQKIRDIDLIVVGKFEKYNFDCVSRAETYDKKELEEKNRQIYVNDFCFVIEVKGHRSEDITTEGQNIYVSYKGGKKCVTSQNEDQKYSLKNFLESKNINPPYIYNFIWFTGVSRSALQDIGIDKNYNFLPNEFKISNLFILGLNNQKLPFSSSNNSLSATFTSSYGKNFNIDDYHQTYKLFTEVKKGAGDLTRKKIERITKTLLKDQQYAKSIGEKLVIVSGRAGTGKTIKLLNIACNLAENNQSRCLILTYNHALVSDIKRTLTLSGIPDGIDDYTVQISTLHSFFMNICISFDIGTETSSRGKKHIPDFVNKEGKLLSELLEYIDEEILNKKDIKDLIKQNYDSIGWDYILIDESQDWKEVEKEVIYRIFKSQNVIVADGKDQLIRSTEKMNWRKGLLKNEFNTTNEKVGLRQKKNLSLFVNKIAEKLDLDWNITPKNDFLGGKIIISTKSYYKELHERELGNCKKNGNTEYEMMFLTPPSLVDKRIQTDEWGNRDEIKYFKNTQEFKEMGINLWDGTNKNNRTEYPISLKEHRIFQYDSCRGLEGWTVVCLNFDDFIEYKLRTFKAPEETQQTLALESLEEKKQRFVYLWSLIPLTRSIDTLIITLNNKNNKISKILKDLSNEFPDFIEWIE